MHREGRTVPGSLSRGTPVSRSGDCPASPFKQIALTAKRAVPGSLRPIEPFLAAFRPHRMQPVLAAVLNLVRGPGRYHSGMAPLEIDDAPEVHTGAEPLVDLFAAVLDASRRLGRSALASQRRAAELVALHDGMSSIFSSDSDPRPALAELLPGVAVRLQAGDPGVPATRRDGRLGLTATAAAGRGGRPEFTAAAGQDRPPELPAKAAPGSQPHQETVAAHATPTPEQTSSRLDDPQLARATAAHFGGLFSRHANEAFWHRPLEPLRLRLARNGVPETFFQNRRVLDAGCGCGRLSFALRQLGAESVVGLDLSADNVRLARRRRAKLAAESAESVEPVEPAEPVEFIQGSVLAIPLPDESFDVVVSFGVLHHTPDWPLGLAEMMRVLRPGGSGLILYLNERPGGLFWDMLDLMRGLMAGEDGRLIAALLEQQGVPPERVIHILDPVLVPINHRLSRTEIEAQLHELGARSVRRFTRGADHDRLEQIYQQRPYAKMKYGVGEHRYIFEKPL